MLINSCIVIKKNVINKGKRENHSMSIIIKAKCDQCGKEVALPGEFNTVHLFNNQPVHDEDRKSVVCFITRNMYVTSKYSIEKDRLINLFFCSWVCQKEYEKQ